jgi:hypothetical protein
MATITLDIKSELPKAIRWTDTMTKQLPFAISQALNSTAFDARKSINASTRQYFDNPTRFIQNAYLVQKSTKRTLTAIVFPEAKRQPYLLRNITGGRRGSKPFEAKLDSASSGAIQSGSKLVPVGIKRNAQGNVSLAALKRLTGQIGPTGRNSVFIRRIATGSSATGTTSRRARARIFRPRSLTNSERTLAILARREASFSDFGVAEVFAHVPASHGWSVANNALPSPI